MTTRDFIKKTQAILSGKLTVREIQFKHHIKIGDNLPRTSRERMEVTVFYTKSSGEITNFTVSSYNTSDNYGIEELLVQVKKQLAGMEEITSHTTNPEIESVL